MQQKERCDPKREQGVMRPYFRAHIAAACTAPRSRRSSIEAFAKKVFVAKAWCGVVVWIPESSLHRDKIKMTRLAVEG